MLSLPYRQIRSPKDVGGSAAKQIDRRFHGLGDAILLTRYQLHGGTRAEDPAFHVLLGLRLPTGSANPNHTWTAADGSRILSRDPVLQPGFGSLDPILGFQWTKPLARERSLYLGTLYRHTGGTNAYGYRFGSEWQVTAGASLPLGRRLTFAPQVLAQVSGHDDDFRPLPGKPRGRVTNTGGQWLYLMPTVRYGALAVNVQIPVYRKTNGNILNPSVILGVRTRVDLAVGEEARARRRRRQREARRSRAGDVAVISHGERVEVAGHAPPGKITLIEFVSRTCGSCKAIAPRVAALVAARRDVALRRIDITAADAPVAVQYGVEAVPAFLLIDKSGRWVGDRPMTFEEVREWIEGQDRTVDNPRGTF